MKEDLIQPASKIRDTLRALGALEEYFWLVEQGTSLISCGTLVIHRRIAPERWKTALSSLQRRHPLLRVQVRKRAGDRPEFVRLADPSLPLRLIPYSETSVDQEIQRALVEPFRSTEEPLWRATVLHGERHSAVVLAAQHLLLDGMTLVLFFRELLHDLGGGELTSKEYSFLPSHDEILGLGAQSPYVKQCEAPALGAQRVRTGGPDGELVQINRMRLTADETSELRMMARERGSSVQGALVAAAVIAGRERSERWMNRIVSCMSPMDDRPSLGRERQPGLLIGGHVTVFAPEHPLILWDMARNVTMDLRQTRERQGAIEFTNVFRRLLANEVAAIELVTVLNTPPPSDLLISNMGEVDLGGTAIARDAEELWFAMPGRGTATQVIAVATVGGCLCLTHTSQKPISELLKGMANLLRKASAGPTAAQQYQQ